MNDSQVRRLVQSQSTYQTLVSSSHSDGFSSRYRVIISVHDRSRPRFQFRNARNWSSRGSSFDLPPNLPGDLASTRSPFLSSIPMGISFFYCPPTDQSGTKPVAYRRRYPENRFPEGLRIQRVDSRSPPSTQLPSSREALETRVFVSPVTNAAIYRYRPQL